MFSTENLVFALTMLEAIEKVFIYSDEFLSAEDLFEANDQLNFNGIQLLLLTIGEDSKKLSPEIYESYPEIPWKQIATFRNRIAHGYRGVDPFIVYSIIQDYLGELKLALISIIKNIDYNERDLKLILSSNFYRHLSYLI